jgi:hypothetical protein
MAEFNWGKAKKGVQRAFGRMARMRVMQSHRFGNISRFIRKLRKYLDLGDDDFCIRYS